MVKPSDAKNTYPPRKQKHISIRTTQEVMTWLKENDYSPTKIFYASVLELGYDPKRGVPKSK